LGFARRCSDELLMDSSMRDQSLLQAFKHPVNLSERVHHRMLNLAGRKFEKIPSDVRPEDVFYL
jgi:hypothetical protein